MIPDFQSLMLPLKKIGLILSGTGTISIINRVLRKTLNHEITKGNN